MKQDGLYFRCKIGKLDESTFAVHRFTLTEALNDLYTLELHVATKTSDIELQPLICQQATFSVYSGGSVQRTITGLVEGIELGKAGFRRIMYKIIIRPHAWLLTLRKDSRIFHFKTVPQILDSMFQFHHVQTANKLFGKHKEREYTTQKRETDYEFLCRLASEEGITFWYEQVGDDNAQIFYSDSRLGQKSTNKLIYNTHPQSSSTDDIASDVRFGVYMRPTQAIHKDRNYLKPAYELQHKSVSDGANAKDDRFAFFDSYGRFDDDEPGKPFTQYRLEALQAESELGRATTNCVKLMPGTIFSLSEHPESKMNAKWQVIRIRHEGICPQALEEEADSGPTVLTNEVEFISSLKEWRAPYIQKPIQESSEVAEVVGPEGEEIHVNEHGAIKVHFHWNRYDKADDRASCWVRVAQAWNGNGYGFLATPRIGQEVLISYQDGDVDRPIVTGANYNGVNKTPVQLPVNKTHSTWRSKTHKGEGFNEFRYEDENEQERIYMHAQKDHVTEILHDQDHTIGNNRTKKVGVDQKETIGQDKRTDVGRDHFETIGNNSVIKVINDQEIQIDNNRTLIVNSSERKEIYADSKDEIGGNKTIVIQGVKDEKVNTKIFSRTKQYIMHAEDKMVIAGPGGSITIDAGGVTIKAKSLKILTPSMAIKGGGVDQVGALTAMVKEGQPFCEICAKAKEAAEEAAKK